MGKIKALRRVKGGDFELLISWLGLEATNDSWEDPRSIYDDIPALTNEFLDNCSDQTLAQHARQYLLRRNSENINLLDDFCNVTPICNALLADDDESGIVDIEHADSLLDFDALNLHYWTDFEEEILRRCVMKFTCDLTLICDCRYLVHKTRKQITNKLHSVLGISSLRSILGLNVDIFDLVAFGDIPVLCRQELETRFVLSRDVIDMITIPYYRSLRNRSQRLFLLNEQYTLRHTNSTLCANLNSRRAIQHDAFFPTRTGKSSSSNKTDSPTFS